MRLTVLGCSGTFPGPASACSAYLVEHDGARLVLDLGSGALGALQRHAGLLDVDVLVLGCTHYPLLTGMVQLVVGDGVALVSSAEETAKDVYRVLVREDLARDEDAPPPEHVFRATGDPDSFARLARRFLGPPLDVRALVAR